MVTGYLVLPNDYYGGSASFPGPDLPAHYVFDAPPALNAGEWAVRVAGAWTVTMTAPPAYTLATPPTVYGWMKAREFLRQFNRADRKTIKDSADAIVVDAMWQLQVNGLIDFSDTDMQAFMDQLVTLGIIGNPKKNRIYAAARFDPVP